MKYSVLVWAALCLSACGDDAPTPVAPPLTAASTAAVPNFASAAASSPIATEILNSSQEQDILSSSRQAMATVSASEIAAFEEAQSDVFVHASASAPNIPPMNAVCTQYFQRVERCFSQVGAEQGEALLAMTREAQEELSAEQPDEESCSALNRSFNAVARNLGCQ